MFERRRNRRNASRLASSGSLPLRIKVISAVSDPAGFASKAYDNAILPFQQRLDSLSRPRDLLLPLNRPSRGTRSLSPQSRRPAPAALANTEATAWDGYCDRDEIQSDTEQSDYRRSRRSTEEEYYAVSQNEVPRVARLRKRQMRPQNKPGLLSPPPENLQGDAGAVRQRRTRQLNEGDNGPRVQSDVQSETRKIRNEPARPQIEENQPSQMDSIASHDQSLVLAPKRVPKKKPLRLHSPPLPITELTTPSLPSPCALPTLTDPQTTALLAALPPTISASHVLQILSTLRTTSRAPTTTFSSIAGLSSTKTALRESAILPLLRPDLFTGPLRQPPTGILLFGPPGTGKTMLARALAAESRANFFEVGASSLVSKWLGEGERLVRALWWVVRRIGRDGGAAAGRPSVVFVDEVDALLGDRGGEGNEAMGRVKAEFLVGWSGVCGAGAGDGEKGGEEGEGEAQKNGDNRVLVLGATNLPWAIDPAARRRFERRQYIPLPEAETRTVHLRTLLKCQKHCLSDRDLERAVELTEGFSGSDLTTLAKDAAMGPLRSLGLDLADAKAEDIRPICLQDFEGGLGRIRASVGPEGVRAFEDWAREFGERGD